MSVVNGSPVDSANTNAAYISKLTDGDTVGKIGFKNTDAISGAGIDNIQRYVNEMADASGVAGEGDATSKQYGSTNFVADGDSRKEAIGKLDVQMKITNDLAVQNETDITILDARVDQAEIDIQAIEDDYGVADGLATLDSTGKVPTSQIPDAALGGPKFIGTWDASTNTPTLSDGGATTSPDQGDYYRVSVAGTTTLDGENDWGIGDWVIFDGTQWAKIDNSESVTSVNGNQGAVTLDADDIAETSTRYWSLKDNMSATTDPATSNDSSENYSVGSFWFNSSSGTLFVCQDNTLGSAVWIIATGGSAGGGLDVFAIENFEITEASDLTTGNNPAFGNTSSALQGTLANQESTPINGERSIEYTQSATSLNDWAYLTEDAITINPKQQGKLAKIVFYASYDGSDGDIQFIVEDQANNRISGASFTVKNSAEPQRYETIVGIPTTATSLRFGFQVAVVNNGAVLGIDDIEFTLNTFTQEAIKDIQEYRITQAGNALSDRVGEVRFNLGTATISDNGESLISAVDDAGNTRTQFVANRKCTVNISWSPFVTGSDVPAIAKNGSFWQSGSYGLDAASRAATVSTEISLEAGEYFTVAVSNLNGSDLLGSVPNSGDGTRLTFLAEALSDHVVTPARSSETVEKILSSVVTTSQTLTDLTFNDLIVGQKYQIGGHILMGQGAGTGTIDIENGSQQVGRLLMGGNNSADDVGANHGINLIFTATDTTLTFSYTQGVNLNSVKGNGTKEESFVQLTNINAQFLAAIPKPLTAILEDRNPSGTAGGTFTSGAWQTRNLNTVSGDSSIVSLSSNQFTLQAGTYEIEATASAYSVDEHRIRLRNVTDSITEADGVNEYARLSSAVQNSANLKHKITIDSEKTFEIQHRCATTVITNGFGRAASFGVDEIYAQVKITKTL